uniref:Ig-like domain-containing protein n=1 Tax=Cyprinodon variegatus TaxID=28743 RepID=A0A3Q2CG21_CYPVA
MILQSTIHVMFRGETVTLRCEIHGGGGAQWTYEWIPSNSNSATSSEYRITAADSRNYRCRGRTGGYITTEWGLLQITATVTLQPNWSQIFRGEKVTLRCEIHGGGGAQWTYEWRPTSRNSPTSSEYRITAADSGEYKCRGRTDVFTITKWGVLSLTDRGSVTLTCSVSSSTDWKFNWFRQGGRGDPVFYTENSNRVTIYKTKALSGSKLTPQTITHSPVLVSLENGNTEAPINESVAPVSLKIFTGTFLPSPLSDTKPSGKKSFKSTAAFNLPTGN